MKTGVEAEQVPGQPRYLVSQSDRIAMALRLAESFGGIDGDHHKTWVIDQMVRALTGCRFSCGHDERTPTDSSPTSDEVSAEYQAWVTMVKSGNEGPNTYDWKVGIAP